MHFHGANVVIFDIFSSDHRTPLIGEFLPSSALYHLPYLEEALNRFPGRDPIVLGDLHVDIGFLGTPGINRLLTSWNTLGWWNYWEIYNNASTTVTFRLCGRPSTPKY